ncbi:hypothetical protein RGQ29_022872 [Quercus rubra]|uniref:EF-hand domain-containing protein n=1 Tax=Quercus rubra TaxID=3512 RepID=A0AAN7F394_QUERU|nr:hypothetical protein RGQ29_022872 [Quercus rubra]
MGFKSLFHRKKKTDSPNNRSLNSSTTTTTATNSNTNSGSLDTSTQMAELEQVFKKFDVNGNGKISASELGSIMGSLGHPATEEELEKMIVEVDANGDGFIDLNEFVELNTKEGAKLEVSSPFCPSGNGGGTDMDDAANEQPETRHDGEQPSPRHSGDSTGRRTEQQRLHRRILLLADGDNGSDQVY